MRHFVQMSCCNQFSQWLAGYRVRLTIAAQIGMAPVKNRNIIANKPKSGLHPTYLETIISRQRKIELG